MQTRSHLNALFLLLLLGIAAAAEAQVQQELAQRYFAEARSCASEMRAGCGVCRSVVRW